MCQNALLYQKFAYITFWKVFVSTRRVIRQPSGVRTNSSSYQSPQNST